MPFCRQAARSPQDSHRRKPGSAEATESTMKSGLPAADTDWRQVWTGQAGLIDSTALGEACRYLISLDQQHLPGDEPIDPGKAFFCLEQKAPCLVNRRIETNKEITNRYCMEKISVTLWYFTKYRLLTFWADSL